MKKIANSLVVFLILFWSCTSIPNDVKYLIVKEEPNVNNYSGVNDCSIEVKINKRVDKEILTDIAKEIRKDRKQYKRLWIKYYLESVEYTSIAWANTDFDPDLKVEINGSTELEMKNTIEATKKVNGEIYGKWYEEGYTKASYVLFKRNDTLYMRTIFSNNQLMDEAVSSLKLDRGTKYSCSQSDCHGEYYIVNDKSELEFYNKDDKMFTVAKGVK
jgi:hypothetical protein